MIALRPYQEIAIENVRAKMRAGKRRIVLCAPTGAGKTIMFSHVVQSATKLGKRALVVAHRRELIDQTVDKLARFGVACGVIMAGDRRRDDWQPVQVASIQTLAQRMDRLPPADIVIPDEAHHVCSSTWRALFDAYPHAFILGATATPWRTDRMGLSDLFEDIVVAETVERLMEIGALVRADYFAYDAPDLHKVRMTAGDFNQKDLAIACNTEVLVGSIVREYLEHANGRRAIVFPVNVEHSKALVGEFCSMGVRAEHVDAKTPKQERARILAGLATGEITVVASVGVLTEGFDCPAAEVVILARPTKSLTLHLQMIGRGLRPSPETGKERALIHDHAGNLLRHGVAEDPREYSLTSTPKAVTARLTCPFCCKFPITVRPDGTCPACGQLVAPKTATDESLGIGERKTKQHVEGRRIDIAEIRARRAAAGLGRELSDKDVVKIATASRRQMIGEYLRLCVVAEQKHFKPGFVANQFRETFGAWPSSYRFTEEELDAVEPARTPFLPLPKRVEAA